MPDAHHPMPITDVTVVSWNSCAVFKLAECWDYDHHVKDL